MFCRIYDKGHRGVSDTITVSGEAKGFFKTSIDTRVYFIKNY